MNTQNAIILGSSGSVGNALFKELIFNGAFSSVVTLVRRSNPEQVAMARDASVKLREILVPTMDPDVLESATKEAVATLESDSVGFSVLGIGAGTGKISLEDHRAVDVYLNAAFARGLSATGRVKHLAFMSAVGADPTADETKSGAAGGARYSRVKGESEEAVKTRWSSCSKRLSSSHDHWLAAHAVVPRKAAPCLLFHNAIKIQIYHRGANRPGDDRDLTAYAV